MKRKIWYWIIFVILFIVVLLGGSQSLIIVDHFTGEWYSENYHEPFFFSEGIIAYDTDPFAGAYTFSKDSVLLFTPYIEGIEEVTELYWRKDKRGELLCDQPNGIGRVFFYRAPQN